MAFSRNVESQGLWIQRWLTGLVTQRSPLYTPISSLGLQIISRLDALIDGLNMEVSPIMTLVRRPAYTRFSSVAFGASDYPLNWYSFQNTSGTIYTLVDTPGSVYVFTATTNAASFTKGTTARGDFYRIGDLVYYCNGTDKKYFDGSTWFNWGITAPAAAPSVTPSAGSLNPQAGWTWGYCYINAVGQYSAMSPASTNPGVGTSQQYAIGYTASGDAQVTNIAIFRTADGGGTWYLRTTVANATSSFTDNGDDTTLNTFIVAPLAPDNAPCPANSSLVTYWDGRLWVASKNVVYWAMGPQVVTGLGEQSFNLTTNFFKLPINVTGFAPTTQGLMVFTADTTWLITGTGGVYFINPWQKNFGILQPNAVCQDGDLVFVFTSRSQVFSIGGNLTEVGLNIRNKLKAVDPSKVSLAIHRSGDDEGLFVSDGSANVWRYSMTLNSWSPPAQPVQGAGTLGSIETSTGTWTLLMGGTVGAKYIWGRNLTSWTDDGGTYTCYATIGSLIIGPPGSKNFVEAVCINATKIGTYPTVGVLLNEISGTFGTIPNPQPEPPQLPASQTISTMRHYLKAGTNLPQQIEHMQVKVSFSSENFAGELLGLGII